MIISRGRRFIFVHIPKTGGTSLALALEARAMKDDILIGDTPKARARRRRLTGLSPAGRLWKHSTLADIEGVLGPDEWAAMRVFTLVRNPWERMVSYYHWLQAQRFDHPAVRLAQAVGFADFLADPGTQASIAAAPYASYLRRADGTERCDLYLRLDRLGEDLPRLEEMLGVGLSPLPHVNASERPAGWQGDWRRAYGPREVALVAGMAAEDIGRFGYGFEPPA